jgi:hypothetical protein
VAAARAASSCRKCVPHHTAPLKERLGSAATVTTPAARERGAPAAERASDPAERLIVVWSEYVDSDLVRRPVVFQEQSQWHQRFLGDGHLIHLFTVTGLPRNHDDDDE